MPKRQKLTTNSDETEVASLFSGDTVFSIPYFQRAYKWKPERLHQIERDILNLVDETTDFHFLGAIIIHGRRSNPSDPDVYDVIDGQQRITTIYLYLCAIVRTLCKHREYTEAAGLFLKYLVIGRETSLVSNAKLHCCKEDRAQLNQVINDVLSDAAFAEKVSPFVFKPLPTSGTDRGRLKSNYRMALRFLDDQVEKEGLDRLHDLNRSLLEQMSVVQIDVWDPTNGPKIFDGLNSRQEPMTTGDLVRNEIFSRVASEHPDTIEEIDQRSWQPFYSKFKRNEQNLFDSYFFPFGLIQDPNLRKSEVYAKLRDTWSAITDPERIIRSLAEYQDAFLDVACGTNLQQHTDDVEAGFLILYRSGAPSSTYPFLMRLSNATKSGAVSKDDCLAVISLIESFLVRRAICGHEPTGLHAVFKRLWTDCEGVPKAASVASAVRKHKTVVWPSGEDVKNAIQARPLYGSSIANYLLIEWNASLGGDIPKISPWIEHVLPDNPDEEWFDSFTREQHQKQKDLLANLLPLSQEMNRSLGNRPYEEKKAVYEDDSAFKGARSFAKRFVKWSPSELETRGRELAEWAISRWSH